MSVEKDIVDDTVVAIVISSAIFTPLCTKEYSQLPSYNINVTFCCHFLFSSLFTSPVFSFLLGVHLRQHHQNVPLVVINIIWCKPVVVVPGPAASPEMQIVRNADSQGPPQTY